MKKRKDSSPTACMEMTGLTADQQHDCDTLTTHHAKDRKVSSSSTESATGYDREVSILFATGGDASSQREHEEGDPERQPLRSADEKNISRHQRGSSGGSKSSRKQQQAANRQPVTGRSVQLNECSSHSRNGGSGMHQQDNEKTAGNKKKKSQGERMDSPSSSPSNKRQSILLKRGDTSLSLDQSGLQRLLPSFMQFAFADHEAESIYQQYYENEKRSDFQVLIEIMIVTSSILLILFAYYTFSPDAGIGNDMQAADAASSSARQSPSTSSSSSSGVVSSDEERILLSADYVQPETRWIILSVLLLTLASVLITGFLTQSSSSWKQNATCFSFLPLLMWTIQLVHVTCDLWLFPVSRSASDTVSWILLYTFVIYVIFPLRLRYCFLMAVLLDLLHVLLIISSPLPQESFGNQVLALLILFVSVNMLGLMSFFFYERQQRRAFLETCQSLEAKLVLEEESLKQERLLLSVLPQHVASEIRRDLGAVVQGQFKKIYMSRHENVSILFADIVGFTAISSTCPAAELVRTLNELFARFDKLADKYHQLRIKILGDCYYCISGAPDERTDHAVLCVHMGLSMVEAIKSVREQTKSPVDMRVGIHTGGILAGVMGQKQWQFDVYSKDVELANKMESGGVPGMVHISEKTYSFLNGEFEVKDGDGSSREEAIRLAGIKTYLIVQTLKQWPEGTQDALLSPRADSIPQSCPATFDPLEEADSVIGAGGEIINVEEYNRRLLHELLNRESESSVRRKTRTCSMKFVDSENERQWRNTQDVTSCVSLVSLPLTLASCFLSYLLIGPSCQLVPISILMLSNSILLVMALLSCASSISSSIPKPITSVSQAVVRRAWIRLVIALSMISVWLAAHVVSNVFCYEESEDQLQMNSSVSSSAVGLSFVVDRDAGASSSTQVVMNDGDGDSCPLPPFLVHFATLGMIAFTVLTSISYIIKTIVVISLMIAQIFLNLIQLRSSFNSYDLRMYGRQLVLGHDVALSLVLLTAAVVLFWINRQSELMSRRLFLWKKEVEEQKEKVGDMRRKNEALVYNILPPHVAVHFLGKRKKDEELYSKSYDCVGVLFAAMPNFSDFYTEESVNNQGLECLRFLNEVISDYDALLEQDRFRGVIKIKTIGSTYMAASGLNDEDSQFPADAANPVKWAHLARLTEFALALKETLHNINKESFNNFVLRIGLNQGPITAGVIGARKPHYDMWGNTVNVASRMESTGKAGSIQVVQETKDLLQELGYVFEQRGLVSVKGKGMLRTFYLISGPNN